jgi:hypothetical protein
MKKLDPQELYSLEQYHVLRNQFRSEVIGHKKNRQLPIGPNVTLYFEDRLTIQYQIQEILRVEKVFSREGVEEELSAYNPLIPDGSNFKATFMIEYSDEAERKKALKGLIGIEDLVFLNVGDSKIPAIADEDLVRENEEKTSAVHFLRFELPIEIVTALKNNESFSFSIEHENYHHVQVPPELIRTSLVNDLD